MFKQHIYWKLSVQVISSLDIDGSKGTIRSHFFTVWINAKRFCSCKSALYSYATPAIVRKIYNTNLHGIGISYASQYLPIWVQQYICSLE